MGDYFMDLEDGGIGYAFDEFGVSAGGDPLMHVGDNMAADLRTGELRFVDAWPAEDGTEALDLDDPDFDSTEADFDTLDPDIDF